MILLELREMKLLVRRCLHFGSASAHAHYNEEAVPAGTISALDSLVAVSCMWSGVKLRLLLNPATLPL
jgi:hypothetical protein